MTIIKKKAEDRCLPHRVQANDKLIFRVCMVGSCRPQLRCKGASKSLLIAPGA